MIRCFIGSILFFTAANFAACSDTNNTDPGQADAGLSATLDNIQEHVFDKACVQCHNEQTSSGGLDLSSSQVSYDNLIGISAKNSVAGENGWVLVKVGEPDLSFLVRKLSPGLGEGAPMPLGTQELTEFYVDLIKNWIASGAQR